MPYSSVITSAASISTFSTLSVWWLFVDLCLEFPRGIQACSPGVLFFIDTLNHGVHAHSSAFIVHSKRKIFKYRLVWTDRWFGIVAVFLLQIVRRWTYNYPNQIQNVQNYSLDWKIRDPMEPVLIVLKSPCLLALWKPLLWTSRRLLFTMWTERSAE